MFRAERLSSSSAAIRIGATLLVAAVIAGTAVGLRLGRPGSSPAEASTTFDVSTQDFHFAPALVTIQVGDTVRWTGNNFGGGDIGAHTTTSDPGVVPPWNGVLFPQNPNAQFEVTFSAPGTYTYHCEIHPASMFGTVVVQAPSPTATPTPVPPTATPTASSTPTAPPNVAPVMAVTVTPLGGPDPLLVNLNLTASDADGGSLASTVAWGDGVVEPDSAASPITRSLTHTYALPGSYPLHVSVQDAVGVTVFRDFTVLVGPDGDGDTVPDAYDNCPGQANPNQANADALLDNGSLLGHDDTTVPNGSPGDEGDACETDGDADNDGLPDAQDTEPLLASGLCSGFAGASDGHPSPAGGDVTNDDNRNGNPAPPMGTDVLDSGASWDTDNDGVLDGYECAHGSNPRDGASKPAVLPDDGGDSDGDGLLNGWERRGWGTDPAVANSDGQGAGDCKEAADVDGNGSLNSSGDLVAYASAIFKGAPKTQDFDIDKNGALNSSGDLVDIARRVFQVTPCP